MVIARAAVLAHHRTPHRLLGQVPPVGAAALDMDVLHRRRLTATQVDMDDPPR